MANRKFVTDDQWTEDASEGPTPGVRYYDGVHSGFVCARPVLTSLSDATESEMAAARSEALRRLADRRAYARR